MKKVKAHKRLFLRISGVTLILTGIIVFFFWHFKLKPIFQRMDPVWNNQFTIKEQWLTAQKNIHNHGWIHDDFYIVGRFGDESWVKWIMQQATDGADLYACGPGGHKASALCYMTNQIPVFNEKSADGNHLWRKWWKSNQSKSQLEWIQDGFLKYKLKVSRAPSKEERMKLLEFLGNTNKDKDEMIPDFIKYNAFRWLRDSGFDPIDFSLSYDTKSRSEKVIHGLEKYQKWNNELPIRENVGILPLLNKTESQEDFDEPRPHFFAPKTQITGYSIMIVLIVLGAFLVVCSFRGK